MATANTRAPILRAEPDGERRWFYGGGMHTWKATAQETGGAFLLFEDRMDQGKMTPLPLTQRTRARPLLLCPLHDRLRPRPAAWCKNCSRKLAPGASIVLGTAVMGCQARSSAAGARPGPPAARPACAEPASPAPGTAPADIPVDPEPKRCQPGRPPCLPRARLRWAARRLPARCAGGLAGAAQPAAVQPVPDGLRIGAQLAGDLGERPRLPGHAVGEVGLQAGEAEPGGLLGEVLVDEAADHVDGGVQLAGERARLASCWQRATR